MGRTKQGGSILGYVLVGGVLILLLLGGAYAFRTWWSRTPDTTPAPAPTVSDKPATDNKDKSAAQQPSTSDKDKSSDKATPAPSQPTAPKPAPTPTTPSTQLPQTGPADTALAVIALGSLVASLGVYLQSRRLSSL